VRRRVQAQRLDVPQQRHPLLPTRLRSPDLDDGTRNLNNPTSLGRLSRLVIYSSQLSG
jgi:hypothetical protein